MVLLLVLVIYSSTSPRVERGGVGRRNAYGRTSAEMAWSHEDEHRIINSLQDKTRRDPATIDNQALLQPETDSVNGRNTALRAPPVPC